MADEGNEDSWLYESSENAQRNDSETLAPASNLLEDKLDIEPKHPDDPDIGSEQRPDDEVSGL
jgi:hypothetical protein